MPRLFTSITLPRDVADHLALLHGGIPGARWQPADRLHLTLRFIGDVDGGTAREIEDALATVRAEPFTMTLAGAGHFPPRGVPRSVWVGVENPDPVRDLHDKIERALSHVGLDPDRRKFAAHVTLARLRHPPERKVAEFLAHHALFCSTPFVVEDFALMSSVLNPAGSKYRVERRFELAGA